MRFVGFDDQKTKQSVLKADFELSHEVIDFLMDNEQIDRDIISLMHEWALARNDPLIRNLTQLFYELHGVFNNGWASDLTTQKILDLTDSENIDIYSHLNNLRIIIVHYFSEYIDAEMDFQYGEGDPAVKESLEEAVINLISLIFERYYDSVANIYLTEEIFIAQLLLKIKAFIYTHLIF